jgi:hypothetical protein
MKDAETGRMNPRTGKPVIYLYPKKTQDVTVRLNFMGRLSHTDPAYNGGWHVTAEPDGTLTNLADGSKHDFLFWDGTSDFREWDFHEGFVVKGDEAKIFLLEKLPAMGLTPRETNDFIAYWAPRLSCSEYNLVTFSTAQYQAIAPLDITPAPNQFGGPVTVTHPEVTRFFMTTEEACQLILQAGSMGEGGEIFVLKMGQPVRIADMAADLIRLSGKEPGRDIEIRFIGLRPGEKLYEELITADEGVVPTGHEQIMVLRSDTSAPAGLENALERLRQAAAARDRARIRQELVAIVPEYTPDTAQE